MAIERMPPQASLARTGPARLNEGRDRILRDIARGQQLTEVLTSIARLVDELSTECRATILLFDESSSCIHTGAAPSLPESVLRTMNGMYVDAKTGSCGAAVHGRRMVVIEDLSTDPLTAGFWPVLADVGVRAAVSLPIQDSSGRVVGTFANYFTRTGPPTNEDVALFEVMRDLAGLAIERDLQTERIARLAADLSRSSRERQTEIEAFTESFGRHLSTPIQGVMSELSALLARDGSRLSQEDHTRLSSALHDVSRVHRMANELIHYAATQRRPLSRTLVHPTEVATAAWGALAEQRRGRKITLRIDQMPACWADRAMMLDVFRELFGNAIRATALRDHAHVDVGATGEEGAIVYRVRDDGAGFDANEAEKVFSLFHGSPRTDDPFGSPTGLALVASIVRRHGGRVWARSRPHEGATFSFTIPGDRME